MKWSQRITHFLVSEDGPTIVEYAILLAVIVGMMIASILYVGGQASDFANIAADHMDTVLTK